MQCALDDVRPMTAEQAAERVASRADQVTSQKCRTPPRRPNSAALTGTSPDRHLHGLQPSPGRRQATEKMKVHHQGSVLRWNHQRGFGFLLSEPIDGTPENREIFAHQVNLRRA
jgi:hypothetical protein